MDIAELLAFAVKNHASDLHLSAGEPPMLRVDGDIRRINLPALDHKTVHALIYEIMNDKQRKEYEEFLETDFSFEIPGLARFRVNAFNHHRGAGAVFRTIPRHILTLEDIGAPPVFKEIAEYPRGLVLVTGPTGSGKSTTLAAMIDHINSTRHGHILTIEDPIEFVHDNKRCATRRPSIWPSRRRRRGTWCSAPCTPARRRRPSTASSTPFPPARRKWYGRCCPNPCAPPFPKSCCARTAAAIRNLIRENKVPQIYSAIQIDQALQELVKKDVISRLEARKVAVNKELF